MLLQPAIIRIPRRSGFARVQRIVAAHRVRQALAAARARRLGLCSWATAFVWMSEPLQTFLSGVDPGLPMAAQPGTPLYRYARYALGAAALTAAAIRPSGLLRLIRAAWPLLAFLAYAAISTAWSQDRAASSKGLLAGAPALALLLAASSSLRPARLLQVLLASMTSAVLASVVAVVLLPHYAVTGAHDILGASAEGDWRGLYGHKNALGHVAGLTAGLLLSRPGRLLGAPALRWSGAAAALLCVLGARSASGAAIALALPLFERALRPKGLMRVALAGFGLALVGVLFAARAVVLAAGLAALGRDETFSGRTAIWRAASNLVGRRAAFGWGLDYSISPDVALRLTRQFGVNHVHNAALDVFLNLGAVGLCLLAATVAGGLWQASRRGPAAAGLALLALGWLVSGLSEDMGVRADGPVAEIGLAALLGLYGYQACRRSFRRPVFGFQAAGRAPFGQRA